MTRALSTGRRLALALVLLAALAATAGASAQGSQRNGAGLVVRHGDGTLVYAYVEFDGESIGGEELLLRSGLDLVVTPYGGLGVGVCAIDGEGCPADNCYCASFGNPAYYWNYFTRTADGWTANPRGPTSHQLADGDIDGWSWTADEPGLPLVTIAEIAAITGFDRSPPPTATSPPTPTPAPAPSPPTATPTTASAPAPPAAPSPPATPVPPPPTLTATVSPSAPAATATVAAPATGQQATGSTTATMPSATPTPAATDLPASSATSTATASSGAVIVRPGATPEALDPASSSDAGADARTLVLFGSFVALIATVGAIALVRRRGSAP